MRTLSRRPGARFADNSLIPVWVFAWFGAVVVAVFLATLDMDDHFSYLIAYLPWKDKAIHFLCFGGLVIPTFVVFKTVVGGFDFQSIRKAVTTVFLISTLEECSQIWISTRTFEPTDLLGNCLGIVFFATLLVCYQARSRPVDASIDFAD